MKKYIKTISFGLVVVSVFVLALVVFPNKVKAASSTGFEYVYFRIDTELDVLNDKGVTVTFTCDSNVTIGSVTDGTASESTGAVTADGIVKLASTSAELNNCDTGDTLRASVSLDGWVSRGFNLAITASTSNGEVNPFTTRASQDYNFVVGLIKDELGGALTVDGTTASASYSGTTASSSYSGGYKYIAATADGTLTGGGDGYVNQTVSVTWSSDYTSASKSADFDSGTDDTYDGTPLSFGHKVQVFQYGSTFAITPITYGVITAGDSYGTTCTGSLGYWYCAVPLANTETSARWAGGTMQTTTTTYTDRSTGSDTQTLSVLTPTTNVAQSDPTPTPTPTPDPLASPTPTPTPGASPTPTPTASPTPTPTPSPNTLTTPASRGFISLVALGLKEGDTISAAGSSDPDIYIPNVYGYKRLFLNPAIFNFYGHLGGFRNVKNATAVTRDKMVTSGLFRNCETNDPKVYGVEINGEDTGLLHWVNTTGAQAIADDANFFKKVFCINTNEFNWYSKGSNYTSVNQVPAYTR